MTSLESIPEYIGGDDWVKANAFREPAEKTLFSPFNAVRYDYVLIDNNKIIPRQELPEYTNLLHQKAGKKDSAVAKHLDQMLDSAPFLDEWEINGIQRPSQQCRKNALSLAQKIFKEYFCLPVRIASSIEEGIMLVYFDQNKARSLKIEVYNSLEIAGLVNQNKSIKLCIDVNNSSDLEQLFQAFKE